MISETHALEIALRQATEDLTFRLEDIEPLEKGWFFPWRMTKPVEYTAEGVPWNVPVGSNGIIVNNETGSTFALGSAYSVERDKKFYDLGYQSKSYDLVILSISDPSETLNTLESLQLRRIDVSYEAGTVWRIPKVIQSRELEECLDELPCIFTDQVLYFRLERLHEAGELGHFEFRALGR